MKFRVLCLSIFFLLLVTFSFATPPTQPVPVVNDGLGMCKLYGHQKNPSYNLPSGWRELPMDSLSNFGSWEEYIDAIKMKCVSLGYTYSTDRLQGEYNWGNLTGPILFEIVLVLLAGASAFGIAKMWKNKKSKFHYLTIIAVAVLLVILLILIAFSFAFVLWPAIDCADGWCSYQ